MSIIKRFLAIFKSKIHQTLDELDSIKDRSYRIQQQYQEADRKLQEVRETTETSVVLYTTKVKDAKHILEQLECSLVRASSLGKSDEELEVINLELERQEEQVKVLEETLATLQEQADELDEQSKELRQDIEQARHTLNLATLRYESAAELVKLNSTALPENLRKMIDDVKADADKMDARHKGIKRIKKREQPKAEDIVKKYASTHMSAAERLAKINAKV